MLSLKKTHGRKGNKRGMLLVMILFIFAISLILICCALMLTTGTRGRVYRRAEDSQARLTVTAAAESFLQALYMGEIKDADLNTIADQGVTNINISGGTMPGMGGATDNRTVLSVSRDANSDVVLEFTTTIDQQTENVQVVLHYAPTTTPDPPPNGHANMIETSGSADLRECQVGFNLDGSSPSGVDNMVFTRGDLDFKTGGTAAMGSIYATLGNAHIGDGITGGTIVLYGENGMVTGMNNSSNINGGSVDNLLFINPVSGSTGGDTWTNGNVGGFHGTNEYYIGRSSTSRTSSTAATSTVTTANTYTTAIANRIRDCIDANPFTAFSIPDDAPQWNDEDDEVFRGTIGETNYQALTEFPSITSNGQNVASGTYYMTGNVDGSSTAKYCVFGGGTIYVGGDCKLRGLRIWCTGATQVILLPGATLNITLEGVNQPSGFLSTPLRTVADATSSSATYPADCGTDIPKLEIVGYGNNHLELDDNCVLDAFLSLYNNSTMAMTDDNSCYYGRILIDNASLGNIGAPKVIPYCPADGGSIIDDGRFHVQYSDFDVVSFWYYY